MSRNKGKRAEREVVDILQRVTNEVFERLGRVPPLIQRNTIQSDRGGFDLVGIDWLALEVKHCETFNLNQWWEQCDSQAREWGANAGKELTPVLFYRKNNVPWRVRKWGTLFACGRPLKVVVDISLADFLRYYQLRLVHENL